MEISFFKYQGTGNDFIMIDNRGGTIELSELDVKLLCDRRTGIGADGLVLLEDHPGLDFKMNYYNSDGSQSFCGNGSRCTIAFAEKLGLISHTAHFLAIDGQHEGKIEGNKIAIHMNNVSQVEFKGKDIFVDTGSPHYIKWVEDLEKVDVPLEGRMIRNRSEFIENGTNVNFACYGMNPSHVMVRTYERGVEDETFSCGTGVTAVALASSSLKRTMGKQEQSIITKGGELSIRFNAKEDGSFEDIWLVGPAEMVFEGRIEI